MRLVTVEQLEMEVAPGLVGEALEKFAGQSKAEGAGHVLMLVGIGDALLGMVIQPAPDEVGAPAEINDGTAETFIHGHVGLAGERILGMKAVAVATDATLIAEGGGKGLAKGDAAILDGVMGVHFQIAIAMEL